jgi:DNA (cytosine-5)-methyltransferase 1
MTDRPLTFGSLFAGIGGFDLALTRSGARSVFAAEIDPKCNSVRRRHFQDERTVDDVRDIRGSGYRCDILCAGWPCQGNSVAGRRAGMADERSGLWGEVVRVLAEQRPRWFFGENVPGILSVNGGQDWATVLGDLAELGYGFAYRVLDAQFFGVPQRRRRVFIVGCAGDWRSAAEVLFERESLPWNPPPRREARQDIAGTLAAGAHPSGFNGRDIESGNVVATLNSGGNNGGFRTEPGEHLIACPLTSNPYGDHESRESLLVPVASEDGTGRGTPPVPVAYQDVSQPIRSNIYNNSDPGMEATMHIQHGMAVRRLTPLECERLQGFPDEWTKHGENGKAIADGPRYRMLGNSVAVPCVEWIGRRIIEATQ